MALLSFTLLILVLFMVSRAAQHFVYRRRYPPGPPGYPVIGNLLDIPPTSAFKKFKEWSSIYKSDILYLNMAGKSVIVLNSIEAATDLLEKRSAIYSDRPHMTMICELMEGNRFLALAPYGDRWRAGRKLMKKHLSPSDQRATQARQIDFVRRFLLSSIRDSPEAFLRHIRNAVGGTMLSIAYGLRIKRWDDPWIKLAEDTLAVILSSVIPGKYLVDSVPVLKHIPSWVPGARGFQRTAKQGRDMIQTFVKSPYDAVKEEIRSGKALDSFVYACLEDRQRGPLQQVQAEDIISDLAGTLFAGGTDSTSTSIINFVLAMLLYPDVQKKAQREIDSVVGRARLPEFSDKKNMPYVAAVLKEVLRWRPVVPTGNTHASIQDDIYKGYFIPKDSIIIANAWSMLHDEDTYQNPDHFDPERYLNAMGHISFEVPDPDEIASFGFGRRRCPGAHIGLSSLWITAVSLLACFDICNELDECGNEIPPRMEYLGKTVVHIPESFNCRFIPRHESTDQLILSPRCDSEYI